MTEFASLINRHPSLILWLMLSSITLGLVGCSDKPEKSWEQATRGLYTADLATNGYSLVGSILHGGSLWRLKDGERIYNWNLSQGTYTNLVEVALSSDGKFGATADDRRIVLWSTRTGKSIGFWNTPADILSVAVSDHGLFILIGMKNFTAIYIDVRQGGILSTVNHQDSVRSVAISADGKIGLTGSDDKTAKLWRLNDGHLLRSWDHDNLVNHVSLSRKAKWALTSGQHSKANIWNVKKNKSVMTIGGRSASISASSFSSNEKQFVVGNTAREIDLWDIKSKKKIGHWVAPKRSMWKPAGARILAVALSQQKGRVLATASNGVSFEFVRPSKKTP